MTDEKCKGQSKAVKILFAGTPKASELAGLS